MPLKTETNTPKVDARVLAAFLASAYAFGDPATYSTFFEHGQWWVENRDTGAQWSVVDAEGGSSVDGFDFERVTEGEDA